MSNLTDTRTARKWNLDASHSLVEFSARHMMITKVKGRFTELEGTIEFDETDAADARVEVEIGAASITTGVDQRDEHLRSADFLDVGSFPTITFRSRQVEGLSSVPGASFRVIGDLTIRDVTREVVLEAVFEGTGTDPWGGERASFSASGAVDRRDFGLTWNQALETGGVLVGNDIKLSFEVQAVYAG
jgi:polyisoprenoid-binding protein YceI